MKIKISDVLTGALESLERGETSYSCLAICRIISYLVDNPDGGKENLSLSTLRFWEGYKPDEINHSIWWERGDEQRIVTLKRAIADAESMGI